MHRDSSQSVVIPSGTSPTEIIYQEEGKDQIELATQSRKPVELSEFETRTALELLKDPNLVHRIVEDLGACGLAGEETNKLVCYLACVSRRLDHLSASGLFKTPPARVRGGIQGNAVLILSNPIPQQPNI